MLKHLAIGINGSAVAEVIPTEYYFKPDGADLGTLADWFTDSSYLVPAAELPGSTSSVHIGGLPLLSPSASKFTYGAIELLPSVNCAPAGTPTATGFTLESTSTITGYPSSVLCNLLAATSINLISGGGGYNFIGCYLNSPIISLEGFTHIDFAGGLGAAGTNGVVAITLTETNVTLETPLPGPDGEVSDMTLIIGAASTSIDLHALGTLNITCNTTGGDYSGSVVGGVINLTSTYNNWYSSSFESVDGDTNLNGEGFNGVSFDAAGGVYLNAGRMAGCVCSGDVFFTQSTYIATRQFAANELSPNTIPVPFIDGVVHENFIMDGSSQGMTSQAIMVLSGSDYLLLDRGNNFTQVGTLTANAPTWDLYSSATLIGSWSYDPLPLLTGWTGVGSAPAIGVE